MKIKVCEYCKIDFIPARKTRRFCSNSCSQKYLTNLPERKKHMSKIMTGKKLSENHKKNISKGKKIFCKEHPDFQTGDKNPTWKGGVWLYNETERNILKTQPEYIEWRKAVFERDDYTCQICNEKGNYLNAHHIYLWSLFPLLRYEEWNGITLCLDCHNWVHSKENTNKIYLENE